MVRLLRLHVFILLLLIFLLATSIAAFPQTSMAGRSHQRRLPSEKSAQSVRRSAPENARRYAPDRVLVRFRKTVTFSARQALHARVGATRSRGLRLVSGLEVVHLAPGTSIPEILRQYQRDPNVLYAEPDYRVHHTDQPNDPSFSQLWNLHNTGQTGGRPDADIDALEAWSITTGSPDVVVGVIDTGIDYNHPDLAANIFSNTADCNSNGVDDDGNGYVDDCHGIDTYFYDSDPMDDQGHGTHVAGTIGAVGNNALGVVGINWQVKIAACKFLGPDGGGMTSDAILCLEYFRDLHARGVNLVATNNSWGGGGRSQALQDAIDAHREAGILFIAAAGNESLDTDSFAFYPANYQLPNVIAVAATTSSDALASFSNFGARTVHLGAPGESILSTLPGGQYSWKSGTSMATPHVTGAVALLKAQDSTRDWRAIKNLLLAGGDTIAALSATITGKRLDVYGAMTCSNSVLQRRLSPAGSSTSTVPGTPVDFQLLHIDCALPAGEIVATIAPSGESLTLRDDGIAPDQHAADGIYSASWLPPASGTYTVSFPSDSLTIHVLAGYTFAPATYSYRTITGTNLNLQTDWNEFAWIDSPFPIRFAGGSFPRLGVSAHGTISFTDSFYDWWWTPLPNAWATTLVAPSWTSLWLSGEKNVYWAVRGTTPSRELVVEWRNVEWYWCIGPTIRFQVVFFENSSDVLFNYNDMVFGTDNYGQDCTILDNGGGATSGIQIGPRIATQYSFDEPLLTSSSALRWSLGAPPPKLSDIRPFSAGVGEPGLDLEVWGVNFQPTSFVQWNGSPRPTDFLDSTHLQAAIPATDLTIAGDIPITVATPSGGTSETRILPVYSEYPVPVISNINPGPDFLVGNGITTFVVTGSGFVSRSVLRRDGADRNTDVLGPTQLRAYLPQSDFDHAGNPELTVFNPPPGGGASAPAIIHINNPLPAIGELIPAYKRVGSDAFQLAITGAGLGDSVVRWDGSDRPTTVDLLGLLPRAYASISAADVAQPGVAQVTVFNPPPGGGLSAPLNFEILVPPVHDEVAQAITFSALNFSDTRDARAAIAHPADPSSSCVLLGLPTVKSVWYRYDAAQNGRVEFNTSGGDLAQSISVWSGPPAWAEVGCSTHGYGWENGFPYWWTTPTVIDAVAGTSYWIMVNQVESGSNVAPLTFTALAAAPVPMLISVSPVVVSAGWETQLQLNGSSFTPTSLAQLGSTSLTTSFVSSSQLAAILPAYTPAVSHSVAVYTPPPGGGGSASLPITVTSFQASSAADSTTVSPGHPVTITLTITPDAAGYDKPVQFACQDLLSYLRCSFSPSSLTPGTGSQSTTLTVSLVNSTSSASQTRQDPGSFAWLGASGIVMFGALVGGRKRHWGVVLVALIVSLCCLLSCGGGGGSYTGGGGGGGGGGNAPVHYTLTVTASSGVFQQTTLTDLTVQR